MGEGDLIVHSTAAERDETLDLVRGLIVNARNVGYWQGTGLTSSAAANDPTKLTGLAVLLNDRGNGTPLYNVFDGQSVNANTILVKYTWNGDMDLNGTVDADDYYRIDTGFSQRLTSYRNGDLDFSGGVDADDYYLIDSAFHGQSHDIQSADTFVVASVPLPSATWAGLSLMGAMLAIRVVRRRLQSR